MEDYVSEYNKLAAEVEYHNSRYYDDDDAEISDYEYDQLTQRLRALEAAHPELITAASNSQKVGGTVKSGYTKVTHIVPMQSLLDVFNHDDVVKFVKETKAEYPDVKFTVGRKIDGLSVSLEYENGKLVRGSTRGNGLVGEDITENIRQLKEVPQSIDFDGFLEVRGEVYMTFKSFERANEIQEDNGDKLFKNPRNCAAGTLRQLNPEVVKERDLSLYIFNIQRVEGKTITLHSEGLLWLESLGFTTVHEVVPYDTAEEVIKAIEDIGASRNGLSYPIDGAVVKVDSLHYRDEMGTTSKVPHWAVAYKYPPEEKRTTVKKIIIQVGRTGRLTPVAIMEPIELAGSTVSKATLHNQDYITDKDIRVGDTVIIRKAAEIIPEIVSVVKDKRPDGTVPFEIGCVCPVCGGKAEKEEDTADIRCINASCPAQFQRKVEHFASKECMDINGLGPAAVEALINAGLIHDIADIYYLSNHREKMISEKIVGKEKSTDNLLKAIEKSKSNNMDRLLSGMGVRNVGKHVSKILAENYADIWAVSTATADELTPLTDVGPTVAKFLTDFFSMPQTTALFKKLEAAGVNVKSIKKETDSDIFAGKTFVITGTLSQKREVFADIIVRNGGKVSGSISKKTSYLLAGEAAGSKLDKANDLGVKVLSEDEFNKMLKEET